MLQKIATGNTVLDMVLCLLLPAIIQFAMPRLHSLVLRLLYPRPARGEAVCTRYIEFTDRTTYDSW